jgi:hypothetical protein
MDPSAPAPDLSHGDLAESLRSSGQSTDPSWDLGAPAYLLEAAAALPQSIESLQALAAARTAQALAAEALRTLDEALLVLAAALEGCQP